VLLPDAIPPVKPIRSDPVTGEFIIVSFRKVGKLLELV